MTVATFERAVEVCGRELVCKLKYIFVQLSQRRSLDLVTLDLATCHCLQVHIAQVFLIYTEQSELNEKQ